MLRRIFLPLLLLLALAAITLPAHAEETADLLDGLKAKSYAAKIAVVDKLAASGDPSVVAPLTACCEAACTSANLMAPSSFLKKMAARKFSLMP